MTATTISDFREAIFGIPEVEGLRIIEEGKFTFRVEVWIQTDVALEKLERTLYNIAPAGLCLIISLMICPVPMDALPPAHRLPEPYIEGIL